MNYFKIDVEYPNETVSISSVDWGDEITIVIGNYPGIALNKEEVKSFAEFLLSTLEDN